MDENKIIAAILTGASVRHDTPHTPEQVVAAYERILSELRSKDESATE